MKISSARLTSFCRRNIKHHLYNLSVAELRLRKIGKIFFILSVSNEDQLRGLFRNVLVWLHYYLEPVMPHFNCFSGSGSSFLMSTHVICFKKRGSSGIVVQFLSITGITGQDRFTNSLRKALISMSCQGPRLF